MRGVPSFCRHSRLLQNCPICAREQSVELRPVISSSAPKVGSPRPAGGAGHGASGNGGDGSRAGGGARSRGLRGQAGTGVRVRRMARGVEDGYVSRLVPGLKSSADAEGLAQELAFAAQRLKVLAEDPPGLFEEIADPQGDLEERTWLAFLTAYLCPLESDDPFSAIAAVRTTWASGEMPDLYEVQTGPRSAHDPARGTATLAAYRAWASRAGSQAEAFTGETNWTPERRFARVFERMSLPGMHRDSRFELLVVLGRLSVYDLRASALHFGGDNETTVAAKRALGIGDPLLLERRAADLATAAGVPLDALDLALHNWGFGTRFHAGLPTSTEPDPAVVESARAALGL
jgi:hypothetical protein